MPFYWKDMFMKIFLITSCDKIDYDYKLWTCVWDTAGKTGKKE